MELREGGASTPGPHHPAPPHPTPTSSASPPPTPATERGEWDQAACCAERRETHWTASHASHNADVMRQIMSCNQMLVGQRGRVEPSHGVSEYVNGDHSLQFTGEWIAFVDLAL